LATRREVSFWHIAESNLLVSGNTGEHLVFGSEGARSASDS